MLCILACLVELILQLLECHVMLCTDLPDNLGAASTTSTVKTLTHAGSHLNHC